jgi:protoporphyrinogen oxidase
LERPAHNARAQFAWTIWHCLTLSALLGAAWLTPWRARLGLGQVSNADALFSLLSLAAILVSALVWRWHPWDMTQKWSLWLHALSAAAIVRLMSSVLAWAVPPSASGFETSARLAAVIIVSVLALDLRLASYRRGGNDLIPVLVYLERARPVRGSVAVDRYWYPTLRYFYEYGPFVSSSLYPSSFRLPNWSGPKPLVSWQTRYLVTSRTLQQARSFFTTTLREIRISRISCFGSSRSLHPLCIPMTEVSSRQNSDRSSGPRVVIVGAGFTGLAAGYELAKRKLRPTILEAEPEPGGLAGTFNVGDTRLERFYHHWFTNDRFLMELATELGLANSLIYRHARTGIYYANSMLRLSSPLDVLRFQPLSVVDRLRLGVVVLAARTIRRWQDLDDKPAAVWLRQVCGEKAYRIVWEPLLRGKFGVHADQISAAWFWSKLRLRGSSRGRAGREQLVYCQGGFARLADAMTSQIEAAGGRVITGSAVVALSTINGRISSVSTADEKYPADAVILTTPLPIAAGLLSGHVPRRYFENLSRIRFLANRCLVLELDRALSDLYWINVNDPSFPFVGVIEHTNFAGDAAYGRRHIVYLSRYCAEDDPFLSLTKEGALAFAFPYLQRMFPTVERRMILNAYSCRADYAQPLVEVGYSKLIPPHVTPIDDVYLATMAQVYPEDRGTNYAIRDGRKVAVALAQSLAKRPPAASLT